MRILVVGAGFAGVCAAWLLRERGARIAIPEQAERPGGMPRILRTPSGLPLEHGAIERSFVLTIQALQARHPEPSLNELQLRVLAGARRFVSVPGGSSYLASWFGGANVVYARDGEEVRCGAFDDWFHAFSGAKVVAVGTPEALLEAVERELLGGES